MDKDNTINLIKGLIQKVFVDNTEILIEENKENNTVYFDVTVKNPYHFLSREGEALSALNHLSRKVLEKSLFSQEENSEKNKDGFEIMIDINGFQKKKIENIKTIVHMMAERARYFKSTIELDPMNAFERRIVHEFLSDVQDLKTESQGVGPSRRVVIRYIGTV